jgi:HlyD family secretion protein
MKMESIAPVIMLLCLLPAAVSAADIACFGRIQPNGGIVNVSAPSTDTIAQVLVQEGRQVKSGDVLAILSSREARQLQLEEARLALNQAELERDSGMRMEREQQQNLEDGLSDARERLATLYANKAEDYVSPEYITEREGEIEDFEQQLKVSAIEMEKLRRSTDLGVTRAQKQVAIAEAALAESTVHSPLDGRVLKVLGRAGEHVGPTLFMIGDTSSMFVRAEVYESDAMRVKVGQKAIISSAAIPGKLGGTVESLGTMIYKSTLESVDTTMQTGSRVVEALIRLDPNAWSDRLINLQVDVIIRE